MKHLKNYFIFICLLLSSLNSAFSQEVILLRTSDGHGLGTNPGPDIIVDAPITFKWVASGTIATCRDAGITFAPKNEGDLIHIKVESIDLDGTNNYLLVYNRYVRTGYSGASSGCGNNYMPCDWIAKLGASDVNYEYLSESEDGKVTFGAHSACSSTIQTGFTITVTSISPKDMEFVSAGVFIENESVNRGGRNQILLGANIKMDGGGNPLTLNEFVFNTSAFSSAQIENLRLYSNKIEEGNKLATFSSFTATIVYDNDITLRSGDNKFYLVADIKPDANGTIPSAMLSSVIINNESQVISPATLASPVAVANTILMDKEHLTYTISENANFYDDGGINGKISANFNGTITFIPATAGKKIKIDFSKLEIFNTSTTGLNDIFNFYDGQTVNAGNLIATLLKESKIIKSTADDGSLTVTLKSVTGVPANGWEAVVSEFVPGTMTFDAVEVSQLSTTTLAGGDVNEQFLLLNLKTTNTLTPLSLQSVYIDASATTNVPALDKAKLYFLGETNTFSMTNLFGEVSVSGTTIQVSGSQELKEGNNYFTLVYDLTGEASNGDIISAVVSKVTVSGEDKAPQTATVANRTVANIFKSKAGYFTKEIHDTWIYTDTKSPYNSTYYNYENADCYITFIPTVPGSVVEIDFSSFDVFYATASYSVRATFEIYSGDAAIESNLLWRLSDNAQSTTGPGAILRSVAADGSITIKFNANTTSSTYAGKGWKAEVRPFLNHTMTVEEVDAFQTNTANIQQGATNQEIIGFSVKTEGNLSTQKVKEIKIDLKNSESVVDKVSIFYSADQKNFAQGVLFASTTDLSTQEITITGEQELPEGVSYFWVAYDINGLAAVDSQVDAALISVKTEDAIPYTPVNSDPAGYRLIKNVIELTNGDNGQITLTQPVKFYDEGGPDLDFRDVSTFPFDGKITFLPSAPGEAVKIEFDMINISYTNYIYIYEGTEVDESKLVTTVSGVSSTTSVNFPKPIISNSPDGALTVRFKSDSRPSIAGYAGWEADVYSYTLQPLYVDNITTTQVGAADIMRGSENTVVQQIKVTVKGDFDELLLNNFNFTNGVTTDAADVTKASLFYTGTSTGIVLDRQVGESATTSPYTFTAAEDIKIIKEGSYYFYLAYDVKQDATPANVIGAELTGISANAIVNSDITVGSVVSRNIKSGMQGTYIIGRSETANFATFAAAVNAAKDGVEGAVIFKIEPGTYNENVLVSAIPGVSASSTITFTSLSGNNDDVIITGTGTNTSTVKYVFKVEQTPYVVLENVSLIPASQSYENCLQLTDQSRYFTLRNCILKANLITSSGIYSGLNLIRVEGLNEEGKNCDYFTAEDNTLIGGYIGVYMYGTGYVALTKQRGAVIRNNTLIDQYAKSIYVPDEQNALIEGNIINSTASVKTGFQAMDIYRNKGQLIIRNNKIVISQNVYSIGIELRSETTGTAQNPALVYNNSISITNSPNASTYGFTMSGDCSNIAFYNNSVNISGVNGRCFGVTGTYVTISNMTFQNNLLQNNTTGGGAIYFFNRDAHYEAFTFSNNAYHCTGDFTNTHTDFAAWETASNEQSSFVEQAEFISASDLHLMEAGELNAGLPISFITTDADGTTRSLTSPTIGAFEFETIVIVEPEIEDGYPKTGAISYNSIEIKTKWDQSGKLYAIIKEASEDAPTKAELLATTAVNLNSGVEYTSKFTSLDEETEYKAYFIFVSAFDVESDIIESDIEKTLKQIFPLSVTLPEIWATVSSGTAVELYPIVSGSVYPYSYEWRNPMNQVISTDSILAVSPTVAQQYQLTVTGSDNQSMILYTGVLVQNERAIATFEDNYLSSESYWQGRQDGGEGETKFYSGSYSFSNTYYPSLNYWGGYSYSNITATEFDPDEYLTQQFRSAVGHGAEGSNTYSVVYAMGASTKIEVIPSEEAVTIPGVYLTNTAYTYSSMLNGDDFAGAPFMQGDYYKVIFKGNTGTTVEYYLADYRSSNTAEHYILTEWKWFDLSALGNITSLTVSVDASRKDVWGLLTPAYFCMDNFGATEPAEIDETAPTKPTNLKGVADETTIALSWTASTDNVGVAGYNVYVNGKLVATVKGTTYTLTGLTAGTQYTIGVEAFDKEGNVSERASVSVTTERIIDLVEPTEPTNLEGVAGETTIALSWIASTDNVGVAGYNVYVNGELVATVTGTTYTLTELTAGTEYTIEVEAFDAEGNVSKRASVSVKTDDITGINNVNVIALKAYPNPFTDYIIVKADIGNIIYVYNISGQCILNTTVESSETRIETVNFPFGTYILKCGDKTVKIVK